MSESENPQLVERQEISRNRFFSFYQDQLRLASGDPYTYYHVASHFDAVLVIPQCSDGRLIIERIYRHPYAQRLWEFPAGGIDPGEDPLAAAGRELEEETGYRAGRLTHLLTYEALPGVLRQRIHLILAEEIQADGQMARDSMELMEVCLMSQEEAWQRASTQPASSFLLVGLLALEHHRREQLDPAPKSAGGQPRSVARSG